MSTSSQTASPAPTETAVPPESPTPPSNPIPAHWRYTTTFLVIPLMALATAFFGSIAFVCALWDRSGRQQHFIARQWARTLLALSFSPISVIGLEKLRPAPDPSHAANLAASQAANHAASNASQALLAVYASNHLSYMDTPLLFARLPFQFRILAKADLFTIPFVGWYLRRSGQVSIDQESPRSAIAGLLRGVKTLQAGLPLFVFPEGGRTPDGRTQPMASGCAFMAIRAQVPLVPVALIGTYELLPIHVYHLHPRPLKMVIGDPIPTAGLTTRDAEALTAQLYAAITTMYFAHS